MGRLTYRQIDYLEHLEKQNIGLYGEIIKLIEVMQNDVQLDEEHTSSNIDVNNDGNHDGKVHETVELEDVKKEN